MMVRASLLGLLACLVTLGACDKTRACKQGTVFATVSFAGAAIGATTLEVSVSIGSGVARTESVTRTGSATTGTIEVTFPSGYPKGETVTIAILARTGGVEVGRGSASVLLSGSCGSVAIDVGVAASDGGLGDLASGDGADLATSGDGPVPDLLALDLTGCVPITTCPATACGDISDGCNGTITCASACQLNAVSPSFANAGDTIALEGRFGATAKVVFPGGVEVDATVLGPNRLSVVVPPGSGEGQLHVTTAGGTTRDVGFRRIGFTVDVQPWNESYPQVEYGREASATENYRAYAAPLVTERFVWLFGGFDDAVGMERAMVNADGTLGRFSRQSVGLVTGREEAAAVRIGNFVYLIGGRDATRSSIASVERAPLNLDGTLGAFVAYNAATLKASVTVGPTTYTGRYHHALAVVGDKLYAFGGLVGNECNSPTALDTIEAATIAQDGSISDFELLATKLPAAADATSVVVRQQRIFAIKQQTVWMASIGGDGTLGAFADTGQMVGSFAQRPILTLLGDKLFAFSPGAGARAAFMADGTLGPFSNIPRPLPTAGAQSYRPAVFAIGNYLYATAFGDWALCGGPGASPSRIVMRAALGAGDSLSTFTDDSAATLIHTRTRPAIAVIGQRVYVIGGQASAADPDIEYATLRPDGSLSAFSALAGGLVNDREGATAAVVNNRLYVAGGDAGGSVEVATINDDGSLSAFALASLATSTTPVVLGTARAGFRLVAIHTSRLNDPTASHDNERLCAIGDGNTVACAVLDDTGKVKTNFTNVITSAPSYGNPSFAMVNDAELFAGGQGAISSTDIKTDATLGTTFSNAFSASINIDAAMTSLGFSVYATGARDPSPPGNNADGFVVLMPRALTVSGVTGIGDLSATFFDKPNSKFDHLYHAAFQLGNRLYLVGGLGDLGNPGVTESAEWR